MTNPFWYKNPSILFQNFDILPNETMKYNDKLNAITRLVCIITIIGFAITSNFKILLSGLLTIIGIVIVYHTSRRSVHFDETLDLVNKIEKEGFTGAETFDDLKEDFSEPTVENPLQNLAPTKFENERMPAPPSFNPIVSTKINDVVRKQIETINKDFPKMNDKLFRDLGDEVNFDNSMRPFYTMPNTRTPNDQKSFADFCYGDMKSTKENNEVLIDNLL
jgi:hypothetical protein